MKSFRSNFKIDKYLSRIACDIGYFLENFESVELKYNLYNSSVEFIIKQ